MDKLSEQKIRAEIEAISDIEYGLRSEGDKERLNALEKELLGRRVAPLAQGRTLKSNRSFHLNFIEISPTIKR